MREVEEEKVKNGVALSMFQVYAWGSLMIFVPEEWQLLTIHYHGFMYIWLVCEPQCMIPPF